MKIMYVEAIKKAGNNEILEEREIQKLPKELIIAYSIQYKKLAENIKKQLEKKGFMIKTLIQVLGCSKLGKEYNEYNGKSILLIGSGKFHALNLAYQTNSPIYIYSNKTIETISKEEIEGIKNKLKASISKFLYSNKIGILVSIKKGQENLNKAIKLKTRLENKNKQAYIFISNSINTSEFENFKIEYWINTACPGLINDSPKIANIDDIYDYI